MKIQINDRKKVLITGATSFIGNALIRQILLKSNYGIIAISRCSSARRESIEQNERVKVIECNLDDLDSLDVQSAGNIEIIFHVAWSSDFPNPRYNLEGQLQNVIYLEKVIRLAQNNSCKKIVCIGSQAECGRVEGLISEQTPSAPETAYGIAKCRAYEYGMELCSKLGIELFWPRLLSAYGPNDKKRTMIMSCLDAAINKHRISFTRCEQIWDYIYVDDVADALIAIGERGKSGVKYSIASGMGRKLSEYIIDIVDITGCNLILEGIGNKEYNQNQVMYLVGDITKLTKDTGFFPQISFKRGIQNTILMNF